MQKDDEDQKLKLLEAMKTLHRTSGHWLTYSMIARAANMNDARAKRLLIELMTEGWLNVRDPDKSTQWLLIQLKETYR